MTTQTKLSPRPAVQTMQTNESLSEDKEHVLKAWAGWLLIGFAVAAAIVLILAYGRFFPQVNYFLHVKLNFREASAWGQLGDFMGGILNPLISACTLAVAVMVWDLQKTELSETQKALKEQAKTAEQQRQEQRFFDLLQVYQQTLQSVEIDGSSGKAAFRKWHKFDDDGLFFDLVYSPDNWLRISQSTEHIKLLKQSWSKLSPNFDHYLRVVFRIIYEMENLLGNQQFRYAKLFRAQLANEELYMIGLNLWLDEEADKMRPAAEKYGLLKHMPIGPIRVELEKVLPANVFGRSWVERNST